MMYHKFHEFYVSHLLCIESEGHCFSFHTYRCGLLKHRLNGFLLINMVIVALSCPLQPRTFTPWQVVGSASTARFSRSNVFAAHCVAGLEKFVGEMGRWVWFSEMNHGHGTLKPPLAPPPPLPPPPLHWVYFGRMTVIHLDEILRWLCQTWYRTSNMKSTADWFHMIITWGVRLFSSTSFCHSPFGSS